MSKNIIDAVEGSKVWGWAAYAGGFLALGLVIWAGKETYEAMRASDALKVAENNLENAISENGEDASGCCGGSSNAGGKVKVPVKSKTGYWL